MWTLKRGAVAAPVAVGALVLSACGGSADTEAAPAADVDCAAFEQYGDLSGSTVTFYTSVVAPDDAPYIAAFEPFEQCTGATVEYEASKEFEAQLVVRVQSGNAPDIALFPQPGLLRTVVQDTDALVPAPDTVVDNVDEYYSEDWKPYGTIDDVYYAAPNGASVKSLVWYSPSQFAEAGYEVPTTWDEMIALSDQVVADNPDGSAKPWCMGISSGDATGWPATDWMEDVMLRLQGPEVYDQWVAHEIPFNGPEVAEVIAETGNILKNPDYVNGGFGDVVSIASTTFQDAGLPVLDAGAAARALEAATEGLARRGRCRLGDKTIYDALRPAADAFAAAVTAGQGEEAAVRAAIRAARGGMLATTPLVARRGLALRLGERSRGHQDPGATSCQLLFRALLAAGRRPT